MRFFTSLIAAALGFFIVFKLWCKGTVNLLTGMQYDVRVVASQLKDDNEKRAQAAAALVEQAKAAEGIDLRLVDNLRKALAGLSRVDLSDDVLADPKAFKAYQDAQDAVTDAVDALLDAFQKAPPAKPNPDLWNARKAAHDIEERVAVDRNVYNVQAAQFNRTLRNFPGPLVAPQGKPEPLFTQR